MDRRRCSDVSSFVLCDAEYRESVVVCAHFQGTMNLLARDGFCHHSVPPDLPFRIEWRDLEGILSRGDQRQRYRCTTGTVMQVFRFKPIAQARIVDLWLTIPEPSRQAALNLEMIQLQLDFLDAL